MRKPLNSLGKISSAGFKQAVYPKLGKVRDEVLVKPKYGVDTAVIQLQDELAMAVSSDPLSLIPSLGLKESAWLSVHLLVNDMATTGKAPQYAQFVLNLPGDLSSEEFEEYWHCMHKYCDDVGVAITGGHTCKIEGQNSTISGGGTMFLTASKDDIITSDGAQEGDKIIMTKGCALSSMAIMAKSFPKTVINKVGEQIQRETAEAFFNTSVLKEALLASSLLKPKQELTAMHDVTEGGVLGAVLELAEASQKSCRIYNKSLLLGKSQKAVASIFNLDARYCIGAGSMIMTVQSGKENTLIEYLEKNEVKAAVIGEITAPTVGNIIVDKGEEKPLTFDGVDPYWAAFFKAIQEGLK